MVEESTGERESKKFVEGLIKLLLVQFKKYVLA